MLIQKYRKYTCKSKSWTTTKRKLCCIISIIIYWLIVSGGGNKLIVSTEAMCLNANSSFVLFVFILHFYSPLCVKPLKGFRKSEQHLDGNKYIASLWMKTCTERRNTQLADQVKLWSFRTHRILRQPEGCRTWRNRITLMTDQDSGSNAVGLQTKQVITNNFIVYNYRHRFIY